MGQWVRRKTDEHEHDYPHQGDGTVHIGDTWRCECGNTFRVTEAKSEYDQRDNYSWQTLKWEYYSGRTNLGRNSLAAQRDDYEGPYGSGNAQPYS